MPLDDNLIVDISNIILERIGSVQFRADGEYRQATITDKRKISQGVVRVVAFINASGVNEIDRVELYSTGGKLWSYHEIVITVAATQTDIVFWFDIDVTKVLTEATEE